MYIGAASTKFVPD